MSEEKPKPWWRSGWLAGLLIVAILHATGMAVHVQAALQRVVLATGLMQPHVSDPASRPAVELDFRVLDENDVALQAQDWTGEVLFVNVWATWCPPCLAEMPAIDRLYRRIGDEVRFVMISVDEDFEQARKFVDDKGYAFPVVRPGSRLPDWLNTGVVPTTVVVDRASRLAVREAGMALYDSDRFVAQLRVLLQENGGGLTQGTP